MSTGFFGDSFGNIGDWFSATQSELSRQQAAERQAEHQRQLAQQQQTYSSGAYAPNWSWATGTSAISGNEIVANTISTGSQNVVLGYPITPTEKPQTFLEQLRKEIDDWIRL